MEHCLRLIPLGGLGEIGRNMLLLEYDGEILIVDAGLMFPDYSMFGISCVLPDLAYVEERADRVRGIVITHGHEDHIGALPYLLERVEAPLYASAFTQALIGLKLSEAQLRTTEMHVISAGSQISVGPFVVDCFPVNHSIPEGFGLSIHTPLGLVVHSGDFKFDDEPALGAPSDLERLRQLGEQGVLALLSDSTNAEQAGWTPSESTLGETLEQVISQAQGRVIVASFASNIARLQQVIDISERYGRRLAVVGRSMVRNLAIARSLGALRVREEMLLPADQVEEVAPHTMTVLCTGSQGEPGSALVRMAREQLSPVNVHRGDTVVISASPIPGNEEMINHTIDGLFRLGANVHYDEVLDVHVSGHASQDELQRLLQLIRPQYFIPIHGEYRHLVWHSRLAEQCGLPAERILVLQSGDVLEFTAAGAQRGGSLPRRTICVDGNALVELESTVQAARETMSQHGVLVAVVVLDKYTNSLVGEPRIETSGFLYEHELEPVAARLSQELIPLVQRGGSRAELTARIENGLRRLALRETGRRPVVIPLVLKV
ncbi:MAG: ribonuclease J [Anaerolineae bacterium]|jgi:ribonuclease J|nr:ribonuclease J [Chloroflexota bacterium]